MKYKEKKKLVSRKGSGRRVDKHTFALQRRGEVQVIVTIATGGPVAMKTGGSGGWVKGQEGRPANMCC